MNNILKSTVRLSALKRLYQLKNVITVSNQQRQITRNLWYMCNSRNDNFTKSISVKLQNPTELCSCGCGKKGVHSKGKGILVVHSYSKCLLLIYLLAERELVEFLTEEILTERKAQKAKTLPTELDGFKAQLNGAEVTLTKEQDNEK